MASLLMLAGVGDKIGDNRGKENVCLEMER